MCALLEHAQGAKVQALKYSSDDRIMTMLILSYDLTQAGNASLLRFQAHSRLLAADAESAEEKETLSERFAAVLTGLYAEQQAAAAEQCGVSGGESWRLAFEAASNSGAKQVQTQPRLCRDLMCMPTNFLCFVFRAPAKSAEQLRQLAHICKPCICKTLRMSGNPVWYISDQWRP